MQKISCMMMGLFMAVIASAQCDTRTTWMASATEFVKADSTVQSKPGNVTVITSKDSFLVSTQDGEEELKGDVSSYQCNWKDSANGNISFKSNITDKRGRLRHATITIEAKSGKTVIWLVAEEEPTKIKLPVDSYVVEK